MRPEDADYHVYTVRKVKPKDSHDGKETVILSSGMSAFTADAGTYSEGDLVAVEPGGEPRAVGAAYIEQH